MAGQEAYDLPLDAVDLAEHSCAVDFAGAYDSDFGGIERQIQSVAAAGVDFELRPALIVGDWVRVVTGPLAGVTGRVAKLRSKVRIVLNVETLGQSVEVEMEPDVVECVDPPDFAAE